MFLLHPRRYLRDVGRAIRKSMFIFQCKVYHVKCHIGKGSNLYGCRVVSKGEGSIIIGQNCILRNCTFGFYGSSGKIVLGDESKINARHDARTGLYVKDGTSITIGVRSLFSNSIEIATTDWHRIVDAEEHALNENRDVIIGNHVWVCRRVLIGKGVTIGNDSVVGAGSIVTKSFPEDHLLIAGNPAVVKKQHIGWK